MTRAKALYRLVFWPAVFLGVSQSAGAGTVNLSDLGTATCVAGTPGSGCWALQNFNGDGSVGWPANSFADSSQFGAIGLTGSDVNVLVSSAFMNGRTLDIFQQWIGPLVDYSQPPTIDMQPGMTIVTNGTPLGTLSIYSTTITGNTAGDLTFNWAYQTTDAGSYFDPAGFYYCAAPDTASGLPSGTCGLFQLTSDLNALSLPPGGGGPPYTEFGTQSISLGSGDTFGAYVLTLDNANGAGTIVFSDAPVSTPEPASIILCALGLAAFATDAALRRRPRVRRGRISWRRRT